MSQLYKVSLWDGSHKKAKELFSSFHPIKATEGHPVDLETGIENIMSYANLAGVAPLLTVGQIYDGDHDANGWQGGNACMLEWNRHVAQEVIDIAVREQVTHYVIPSTNIDKRIERDRITLIFPFDDMITDKKQFQTIASRVFKDIERPLLTPGSCSYTFFFKADAENPFVTFSGHDYEGEIVDTGYQLSRSGQDGFIKVADFHEAGL